MQEIISTTNMIHEISFLKILKKKKHQPAWLSKCNKMHNNCVYG